MSAKCQRTFTDDLLGRPNNQGQVTILTWGNLRWPLLPPRAITDWGSRGPGFKSRQPDAKWQFKWPFAIAVGTCSSKSRTYSGTSHPPRGAGARPQSDAHRHRICPADESVVCHNQSSSRNPAPPYHRAEEELDEASPTGGGHRALGHSDKPRARRYRSRVRSGLSPFRRSC
jgi:hypothetical protein